MASTYSTNLAFELPGTGDQAGTWGITNNTNIGTLIEQAISGYVTQAVSTGTDTTITIPNGSSGVARNMTIELTGTGGTNTNLIVPANRKLYFIFNNTSSGQVTVKVSGQTGVSVPNGQKMVLVCNGTDVVTAVTYAASLSVGTLSVSSTSTFTGLITANGGVSGALNGTVGATTPNTGAFTNLSYTGTLTGGTGIVNLGSGQFYKDASGNVGIGTASPVYRFDVQHTTNGIGMRLRNTSTAVELATRTDATTSGIDAGNAPNGMTFSLNTVEGMRLTSTGLGIGTASPAFKLDVIDGTANSVAGTPIARIVGANQAITSETGTLSLQSNSNMAADAGGSIIFGGRHTTASTNSSSFGHIAGRKENGTSGNFAGYLQFGTSDSLSDIVERMRLDSSGNLGLGVTPSASWFASSKAIQIGSAGAPYMGFVQQTTTTCDGYMLWGARLSGDRAFQYTTTGDSVCAYRQNAGTHSWFTAPSGTAGNAITFTQAMTLDASGNLGIGTASPSGRLHITTASGNTDFVHNVTGSGTAARTSYQRGGTVQFLVGLGAWSGTDTYQIASSTGPLTTLDSSGNLGIGTASPSQRLEVNGNIAVGGSLGTTPSLNRGIFVQSNTNNDVVGYSLYVNDGANNRRGSMFLDDATGLWGWDVTSSSGTPSYVWRVATAEVMRLTDTGNLGIGTASPSFRLDVQAARATSGMTSTTGTNDVLFRQTNTGGNFSIGMDDSGGTNYGSAYCAALFHSGARAMLFGTNNTERMRITSAGNIVAGASAALATTATDGFLYVPTCAGTPTGTPTAITGMAAIVVNTTNNKLYFYSGGAWRDAGP